MKIMARVLSVLLAAAMLPLTGCSGSNAAVSSASSKVASSKAASAAVSADTNSPEKNDYSKNTYKITETLEKLKINGRYAVTNAGEAGGYLPCITFDNSSALLSFNADCEGDISVDMTIETLASDADENKHFLVVVDGAEQRKVVTGQKGMTVKAVLDVAKGLSRGNHTIEIYRQFEAGQGLCDLISITVNGVITERPKNKELFIEFFGDSITAGYGNLTTVDDEDNTNFSTKSSGTDTYAFLTAKALNADMYAVAQSGVAYAWGVGQHDIFHFWSKTTFRRGDLGDYKAERQPDIVVINLGTNDHARDNVGEFVYVNKGFSQEQMTEAAVKLLTQVRKDRPNAKIVWFYGMMGNRIGTQIEAAVEQAGGSAKGFYYLEGEEGHGGGGWHPAKDEHKVNAEILTNFIRGIL